MALLGEPFWLSFFLSVLLENCDIAAFGDNKCQLISEAPWRFHQTVQWLNAFTYLVTNTKFIWVPSSVHKSLWHFGFSSSLLFALLHPTLWHGGCNSFGIVCVSVCPSISLCRLNGQTYRLEFWHGGQMGGYVGQGLRSRSKIKVTRSKNVSWSFQLMDVAELPRKWLGIQRGIFSKRMRFFSLYIYIDCQIGQANKPLHFLVKID